MMNAYATNTLRFDAELCNGCGMCRHVCPHAVFAEDDGRVRLGRPEDCMECGACQLNCPTGALQVEAGTGCAYALMRAAVLGHQEATCGGDEEPACCCGDDSQLL